MAYLTSGKKKLLGSNTEGKGIDFWQPNTDYKVNDSCLYKNTDYYSLYICTTEHTSADAFVSAYWEVVETTAKDTLVSAINEIKEGLDDCITKENIVTTLDDTVTDEQVASALLTKTELDKTNARLVQLETKQINKTSKVDMHPKNSCYKITPKDNNSFSKILIVDLYGGCVLITGSILPNYKGLKAVRLSNGCWESYSASDTAGNKIDGVYHDDSYIYVSCLTYMKINFEGGFTNVEKIDSLPSNVTQLPILDLTQNKLNYSTVADVGVTTITPVNGNITGTIEYTVKNGICYVSMKDLMSKVSASSLSISTTMPKPSINVNTVSVSSSGDIAKIHIDKATTYLIGDFYQKNITSSCMFSYPVASE